MQLNNQVAIITGAALPRGIGWATAKRFADEGARVVILDLNASAAEQAAASLGAAQPGRHLDLACDVRDEALRRRAVQRVLDALGRIDILVNNAGVSQSQRLMDSTQADYDLVMDSSVRGAFNMSRADVPHMRECRRGAIVCMGSVAAQRVGARRERWDAHRLSLPLCGMGLACNTTLAATARLSVFSRNAQSAERATDSGFGGSSRCGRAIRPPLGSGRVISLRLRAKAVR